MCRDPEGREKGEMVVGNQIIMCKDTYMYRLVMSLENIEFQHTHHLLEMVR